MHFEQKRRRHGVAPALFSTPTPGDHAATVFICNAKQSRDFKAEHDFTYVATSFEDLASQLGD